MAGRYISLQDCWDFLSSEPSEDTPPTVAVPPAGAVFVEITPRSDAPEEELVVGINQIYDYDINSLLYLTTSFFYQ